MTQSARKLALKGLSTVLLSVSGGYVGNIFIQYLTAPTGARDADILTEIITTHPPIGFSLEPKDLYFAVVFFVFTLLRIFLRMKAKDFRGQSLNGVNASRMITFW